MSIQSSINTMIGSIAAVKKAHDIGLQKQAMRRVKEQQAAIKQQKEDTAIYIGGQKVTDPNLLNKIKTKEKENGGK